ncbi:MAG: AAA family ATPase [Desulfobacterales bacterium]|nr:AAA family ATPase [Desulfobacterales bacterium]
MKVTQLQLKNYRPFEDIGIKFGKQLTVIVGVNGAGKTSILENLAILLSRLIGRIRSTTGTGRFFTDSDIKSGMNETVNSIEIEMNDVPVSWTVAKTRRGRKKQTITNLKSIKGIVAAIYDTLEVDENGSVPLALFYGVNRSVLDVPLRIRTRHKFDQLAAYDQGLSGGRNDFRRFFEWYRDREDLENEMRLSPVAGVRRKQTAQEALQYRDPQLQAVREAIYRLTGFSNIGIKRNPLRMEVQKGTQPFDIRQLSDGEKCLLALAGDLAHRLSIANPGMSDPLNGYAVVLIDEIELHLHPEWQHRIIPSLVETFPNCQFILTTHSPQVLSHVKCENIWCLVQSEKDLRVDILQPEGTYGQDSNFLLKTLMRSSYRPIEIDEKINRLFRLIREDTVKARALLNELKNVIEGDSPDIVRAEVLLHRREVMNQ